jgi:cytidylate kinase
MDFETLSTVTPETDMTELVEKAFQHWQARRAAAAAKPHIEPTIPHAFSIALSREAGTQASAVAQELGRLLGWLVYDRQLLEKIAQDLGLRTNLLESVDERRQSWLTEALEGLMSVSVARESDFAHHLVKTVLALGTHGECVIVGRGAAFILPPETTLRVWLVGSLEERVAAWGQMLGISEQKAAEQVRTLDRQRADFLKSHFRKTPTDPCNFDLILNAPRLSIVQLAELIAEALRRFVARQQEKSSVKPPS